MVALVAWVALGVVSSLLARERGRSPLGWFIGGLLLPFLAIIIVGFIPDRRRHSREAPAEKAPNGGAERVRVVNTRSPTSGNTYCEKCGHVLGPAANFCSACGAPIGVLTP